MKSFFELTHVAQEKYLWGTKQEHASPARPTTGQLCVWRVTEGSGALQELNRAETLALRAKLKAEHLALVEEKRELLAESCVRIGQNAADAQPPSTAEEQGNLTAFKETLKEMYFKEVDSYNWATLRFAYRVIGTALELPDANDSLGLPEELDLELHLNSR